MTEDPELEAALMRSYNTFMSSRHAQSGGRIYFNAVVPFRSPDAAVAELRRLARSGGMVSVFVRGLEWDKPLDHPSHYPIYAEAERLGLPMVVHLGPGCPAIANMFDGQQHPAGEFKTFFPPRGRRLVSTLVVQFGFYALVESSLIDDFPKLRWAFLEGGGSEWAMGALSAIGRAGKENLRRYFDDGRIFLGCEPDEDLGWVMNKVGADSLVVSSDMPHFDETSHDNVVQEFEERSDLAPAVMEKLIRNNALRLFDFAKADARPAATKADAAE
jgi:predicted TIM-barrel fold metal-dependent hydrolase